MSMVKLRLYPACVSLPIVSSRVVFYVSDFAFFYLPPFYLRVSKQKGIRFILFIL